LRARYTTRDISRYSTVLKIMEPFSRSTCPFWGVALTIIGVDAIWLGVAGIRYRDEDLFWTLTIAFLAGGAIALRLGFGSPHLGRVGRACRRFARVLHMAALILTFGIACLVMDYLVASLRFPLADELFLRWDLALGLDWQFTYSWITARLYLSAVIMAAYQSMLYQMAIAAILLSREARSKDASEFVVLLFTTAIVATVVSAFLPAMGEPGMIGTATMKPMASARDGTLSEISLGDVMGLVTFPSWHAAMGVVLAYSLSNSGRAAAIFVPLNLLMIVATAPAGGHYFVDTLAGCALAGIVIFCVRYLGRTQIRASIPAGGNSRFAGFGLGKPLA
jgi:membrane-associated phospholipid phosphatase